MIYFAISGIADVVLAAGLLAGIEVATVFDMPPIARSPREFWSRRWNRYVHALGFRHLFLPLGGRRHPLLATAAVFVASGLGHEFLVFGALGTAAPFGLMTAFFALHGLATVAQMAVEARLGRRHVLPRPLAIAAFLAFLLATAPLFLVPLQEIFGYTGWRW
jgi:D-alanyl-lipoteichoic acid acyltransferase DltB (MBOAT superfamily)